MLDISMCIHTVIHMRSSSNRTNNIVSCVVIRVRIIISMFGMVVDIIMHSVANALYIRASMRILTTQKQNNTRQRSWKSYCHLHVGSITIVIGMLVNDVSNKCWVGFHTQC